MGEPWYGEGLRFTCRRCGNCCGGAPGNVWVTDEEIAAIAAYLGIDAASCERRYVRRVPGRGKSLIDKDDYDCVFYRPGEGCAIYPRRPRQCRAWPFWRSVLASRGAWEMAAETCPGIGNGELHDRATIEAIAAEDGIG